MEYEQLIKERYSVRKFSDKEISQEELDKILDAGRVAPTAKNLQPIKVYVLRSEDALAKMDKACKCRYGSKIVLFIVADKTKAYTKDYIKVPYNSFEMDASIVMTHMMLEASNLGIGNVWVKAFNEDIIREEFNLPDNIEPVALLPLGYPADDAEPNYRHFERISMKDFAEEI